MKVLVVFVLLFGVALSRPARSFSNSDSDSSEEVMRRPTSSLRKGTLIPQTRGALVQTFRAGADSDESTEDDQQQEAAADDSTDGNADTNAPSETDSEDSEDDDDTEEQESEEAEEEEEEDSSNSSESGESTTDSPATPTPIMVTEEPLAETTIEPIMPTIITDPDQGRGDSLGGYPSDYKSIVYAEDKSYNKNPSPYKSYEYVEEGKKSAYDMTHGNEVEKSMMVYKVQAVQVHPDYLEEDTSTPEVDSQSLDNSVPEELEPRQASLPAEAEEEATASSDSGSSSTPEEEEDSASASQDDEDDESQSNEESEQSDESDESESDEQGIGPDTSTDMPVVITAK
ncbi:osteopontin isoform 1-T1 [Synchiropus picturatus]